MGEKSQIVKHLEMIQGVINRLAHDSFLIKGWSMTILSAAVIFIARGEMSNNWLILAFAAPVLGFWILDGFFLWQEHLFRALYDEARTRESTDFGMDTSAHKPKHKWLGAVFSKTLAIFYTIELAFIGLVFFILHIQRGI